jgi:glycosyltransferase involved in cell wall biosynthesis
MKTALVHDWLTNLAGAERVLIAFHELYPDAPIYTSVYFEEIFPELAGTDVHVSFLQKLPFLNRKHQAVPFLRTVAFERFDLSGYDVVLSSSHAEAKGVMTGSETLHICYCHTPTRYYWSGYQQYFDEPGFSFLNPLVRAVMPFMVNRMRIWDRCAADRVDLFVCNSQYVARRIKKYYRRDAVVIPPPVKTGKLHISDDIQDYFLLTGRLIPYKRADIVVQAFNELGLPLKIVGTGTEMEALMKLARPNVQFLGRVPDEELWDLYSHCLAFLFPQEEDFGITPLEAMAAGRPVIAYRAGGALETVVEGKTGIFFDRQDPQSIMDAVRSIELDRFDPEKIREHAQKFDESVFKERIEKYVSSSWERFQEGLLGSRVQGNRSTDQ